MRSTAITRKVMIDWILSIGRESLWAPLAVFSLYLVGLAFDLYDVYPRLDIPTHFMGGVTITYLYRVAIRNSQVFLGEIPLPVQILFAFTCTGTTVVLWEFYEIVLDTFLKTHMVLGLYDTIKDMLLGLSGALVITVLYRRR
jgi:hypothetical protein